MTGEPWAYSVPYQPDVTKALHELREREFRAGRYCPVLWETVRFPDPAKRWPGAQHDSIEDAIEAAEDNGTASILDIHTVREEPDDFEPGTVAPLSEETLLDVFGTAEPTLEVLKERHLYVQLNRSEGAYVLAYRDGQPSDIVFVGCSYD